MPEPQNDPINRPSHYTAFGEACEPIKVLEAWLTPEEFLGFLKGSLLTYTVRARLKNGAEDHAKASWYADRIKTFLATPKGQSLASLPVTAPSHGEG